jgi:hypothetical protein
VVSRGVRVETLQQSQPVLDDDFFVAPLHRASDDSDPTARLRRLL